MKLYKLPEAQAGERWHSARTGLKNFVEVELPKDGRAGMAKLFNDNEREVGIVVDTGGSFARDHTPFADERQPLDAIQAAELRAVAAAQAPAATLAPQQLTADAIVAFILNDATVAQAEAVFAALGTRFKEQADAAR